MREFDWLLAVAVVWLSYRLYRVEVRLRALIQILQDEQDKDKLL